MSWASIAENQTVSYNNLQDAVNTGQLTAKTTIPSSNQQVTKSAADTYVEVVTSYPSYAVKASNQLIVKSNLVENVKIFATGQIGGTWGLVYGTNGTTFQINNQATGSVMPNCVATSRNGTYILLGRNGVSATPGAGRLSQNGGTSFFNLTAYVPTTQSIVFAVMSQSGQYMVFSRTDGVSSSSNFQRLYTSNDYGTSFTETYITFPLGINWWQNGASMSADGSRILIAAGEGSGSTQAQRIYSNDYGATWTTFNFSMNSSALATASGMSSSGQYQLSAWSSNISHVYVSNNYGASWTNTGLFPVPLTQAIWVSGCVSSSGQYMLMLNESGRLYISSNYGVSWSSANGGTSFPDGGTVIYDYINEGVAYLSLNYNLGASTGYLYRSVDYGDTWSIQSSTTYILGPTLAIANI
jgi:hypothetical protein